MQDHGKTSIEELIMAATDAADLLGVTPSRISALCTKGILTYATIGGRRFPYRASVAAYQDNERRIKFAPKKGKHVPLYKQGKKFSTRKKKTK